MNIVPVGDGLVTYAPDAVRDGHAYGPSFIEEIKKELLALPWRRHDARPRFEYFMADTSRVYSYDNKPGQRPRPDAPVYTSAPWTECCLWLRNALNDRLQTKFNGCFLNKYDDEHQHLGWHQDDHTGMDPAQPIAVVSFGAVREIWVQPNATPEQAGANGAARAHRPAPGVVSAANRIALGEGSLFVMPVGYQSTHWHRIPKHPAPCGWRISLTFRSFL